MGKLAVLNGIPIFTAASGHEGQHKMTCLHVVAFTVFMTEEFHTGYTVVF